MPDALTMGRKPETMPSVQKVARFMLAFVLYSTLFLDRWEYSKEFQTNPDSWMDVVSGTAVAPQQYRIGVVWTADVLRRHAHLALRHGFLLIDAFSAVVAVYLLFSLFVRTRAYLAASESRRWFGAAAFVFLVQYYFAWIAWYQRPETLASLGILALTLWLLNLAAYNAWAAGGPPEPEAYKKVFAERSNMFFGWTCASFTALAAFTIWNLVAFIRHRRKQSSG